MATIQQLETALVNAHKAGDTDAARKLAVAITSARQSAANQIPGAQVPESTPKEAGASVLDNVIGAGEAALTAVTGATGGALGMVGGALGGIAGSITTGEIGTQQGVRNVEQAAMQGADALTYTPRTAAGQRQAQVLGEVMQNLIPIAPLAGEAAVISRATAPATRAAADQVAATAAQARTAAAPAMQQVMSAVKGEQRAPTPGTMGSVGSAGTDLALQRQQVAESLPVPVKLTKGQAERTFEQQRFEQETAKDPSLGAPLRDRYAQQNENILKNFDAWVDMTGAEAPNLRAVGQAVDKALVSKAARDKTEIRVAYKEAEKAGELSAPVSAEPVVSLLNESASAEAVAPVLSAARKELVRLGGAVVDEAGNLIPQEMTLANAELLRRFVNKVAGADPTSIKYAADIKRVIDGATDGAGGDLYRKARGLRARYAEQYENRAVIAKLLDTKRGTSDRQIAFEDVFSKSVLGGSLDDVRTLRKVLQTGGDDGKQAWRELQGATVNWLKDEATKGVATDVRGNPIVSAAGLNKAIRTLDHDGKLDYVFGKRGAQQLRDINDLAKLVFTSPPGSVNTSNTASVLLAALTEAGVTGSMTGLPVPVLSGLRVIAMRVKDRRIQKRIEEALGDARRANDTKGADKVPPVTVKPSRTLH